MDLEDYNKYCKESLEDWSQSSMKVVLKMKYILLYNETNYDETYKTHQLFETEEKLTKKISELSKQSSNFTYKCYEIKEIESRNLEKIKLKTKIAELQDKLLKLG